MTDQYRVIFAGFDPGVDSATATARLSSKLNIPEAKAAGFFAKKPLFAPSDKEKAMKQVKLLASLGISAKLQSANTQPASAAKVSSARDERLFEALDYITSSLIRLEERLEEIEQRLGHTQHTESLVENDEDWEDDTFLEELDIDTAAPKRSPIVLYSLVGAVAILIILLALTLVYPDIMNF